MMTPLSFIIALIVIIALICWRLDEDGLGD